MIGLGSQEHVYSHRSEIELLQRLKSASFFTEVKTIFGVEDPEELKSKIELSQLDTNSNGYRGGI